MIPVPSGVRVWLSVGRTDMRRGMNGLALQVQETLGRDPFVGRSFRVPRRRGDLIKILWHDGLGPVAVRQAAGAGPLRLAVDEQRQRLRSRPHSSPTCSKVHRNIPSRESDKSSVVEVTVQDPAHPLFGRTFRVIRQSVHRGGGFPVCV